MFSSKTFSFLIENRMRDDKEWFHAHRDEYLEYVLEPLAKLSAALGPTALTVDPLMVTEPKVDRTISRIYRDTRFTKDKLLYRENMWLTFRRNKKLYPHYPELYFVISPNGFSYGCGYYWMEPETLERARAMMLEGHPLFTEAFEAYQNQDLFTLEGDAYKRTKFPDAEPELRFWLDHKSMAFTHRSKDFELLTSDERLPAAVAEGFRKAAPYYRFLLAARTGNLTESDE